MLVQHLTRNVNEIWSQKTASAFGRTLFRVVSTGPGSKMIVAITQMCATNDKSENLKKVQELVKKAKAKSVKFLFLPECCDFVGLNLKETLALSEPLTGATVSAYTELARKNSMWLSLGGIHASILDSSCEKTKKIYNAHVVIDSNGEIVEVYNKLHLFDAVIPNFQFRESDIVTRGERIVPPLHTPIGCLGLQICYDVRFPEVATALRKLGAEILTYPAAFAFGTGKVHWDILIRARAIENQCYVMAPAQTGFHNPKRQSYGHGLIVDPWGQVMATTAEKDLGIATAVLDLKKLHTIRRNMPCMEHRRKDVYSLTAIETSELEDVDRKFSNNVIPKETIFFESPHSFAFTNLRCVVKGHVLVSPKRPAPRLQDLDRDENTDLFSTVCKIQQILEEIYKTSAATVTVQDGPDAGQEVKHVHFHVMPRRSGDFRENDQIYIDLSKCSEMQKNRDFDEMVSEAQMYRNYIANQRLRKQRQLD